MAEFFYVTSVDKFHGRNKEVETVELPDGWYGNGPDYATLLKRTAHALRTAGILVKGQGVYETRCESDGTFHVFPRNAPGLTTGLHSLTLHASLGCYPLPAPESGKPRCKHGHSNATGCIACGR